MKFAKFHGAGNDFIIIDARDLERDWFELAQRMCDRHFGAGADGLILVCESEIADLRMRLFNADGSEAELSGNGLRCFVKYAVERSVAALDDGSLSVETLAGVRRAGAVLAGGRVEAVRIGMGRPVLAPAEIPVATEAEPPLKNVPLEMDGQTISVTCLSVGNPHAVHFSARPVNTYPLDSVGPKVERHPLFPNRVNFEVARVLDKANVEIRVWERGVGETLACGSGASAVMVAAHLQDMVDDRVEIGLPGGALTLEWDGEGEVYLTGPAAEVFDGDWPE